MKAPTQKLYRSLDDDKTLIKFFKEHLLIRNNSEIQQKKPLPEINRPFMRKLVQAYSQTSAKDTRKGSMFEEIKEDTETLKEDGLDAKENDEYDHLFELEPLNLELGEVYKKLDKELPKIPEEIHV